MPKKQSKIHLIEHPVLVHLLTEARDRQTRPARFRQLLAQLGELLAYEAGRDLPLRASTVQTPLEQYAGQKLGASLTLVPILRAGLGMAQGLPAASSPDAQCGHDRHVPR